MLCPDKYCVVFPISIIAFFTSYIGFVAFILCTFYSNGNTQHIFNGFFMRLPFLYVHFQSIYRRTCVTFGLIFSPIF